MIVTSFSNKQQDINGLSLDSGVVPMDWKRANVCVIYKKGIRNECGNYRPVSLTSQQWRREGNGRPGAKFLVAPPIYDIPPLHSLS
mgnify:CR=1 FL=1